MKIEIPPFEDLEAYKKQFDSQSSFAFGTVHGTNELVRSVCAAYPHKMAFAVSGIFPPPFDTVLKKLKGEGYQMQELGADMNFDGLKRDTLFCFNVACDPLTGILAPLSEINKKCESKGIISINYFGAAYMSNLELPNKPSSQEAWILDPLAYDEELCLIVKGDRIRVESLLWGESWISHSRIDKFLKTLKPMHSKSKKDLVQKFEKNLKSVFTSRVWTVGDEFQRIWDRSVCSFSGVNGEALAIELKQLGFEISTSSACFWNRPWPFTYLKFFGLTDEQIQSMVVIPSEYLDQEKFESAFHATIKKLQSLSF